MHVKFYSETQNGGHLLEGLKLGWDLEDITIANKYLGYAGGDMDYAIIANPDVQNGRKLLVIKESFANAMLPFLAKSFEEVHVVDFRYYTGNMDTLIREAGITDALFLNYIITPGVNASVSKMEALTAG